MTDTRPSSRITHTLLFIAVVVTAWLGMAVAPSGASARPQDVAKGTVTIDRGYGYGYAELTFNARGDAHAAAGNMRYWSAQAEFVGRVTSINAVGHTATVRGELTRAPAPFRYFEMIVRDVRRGPDQVAWAATDIVNLPMTCTPYDSTLPVVARGSVVVKDRSP